MIDYVPPLLTTCCCLTIRPRSERRFFNELKAINEGRPMWGTIPPPKPTTDCPDCNKGKIMLFTHEHPCDNCGGSGKIAVESDTKKEDEDDDDIYYGLLGCGF